MEEQDFFNEKPTKATGTLNVLTILTFIGSGIQIIMSAATPFLMSFSSKMMNKALEAGGELTPSQIADMEKAKAKMQLTTDNIIPLVSSGVIAGIGCIIAAIMMRKLKKDGFIIYAICELLPLVVGFIFLGLNQFDGIFSYILSIGIPVLFIVLYATQRKQLTN